MKKYVSLTMLAMIVVFFTIGCTNKTDVTQKNTVKQEQEDTLRSGEEGEASVEPADMQESISPQESDSPQESVSPEESISSKKSVSPKKNDKTETKKGEKISNPNVTGKKPARSSDKHEAVLMRQDGIWEKADVVQILGDEVTKPRMDVSISVNKKMSRKQMLQVLDYLVKSNYETETHDAEMIRIMAKSACYAVFYWKDSQETIQKFKYFNGKSLKITGEDQQIFNMIELDVKYGDEMEE